MQNSVNPSDVGPIRFLLGNWEGKNGKNVFPDGDLKPQEQPYWESQSIKLLGDVRNFKFQNLVSASYTALMTEPKEGGKIVHMEQGFYSWDKERNYFMKSFAIPRGISILAGGFAKENDKLFRLSADAGNLSFGILNNPVLNENMTSQRYDLDIDLTEGKMEYLAKTTLVFPMTFQPFQHEDSNILMKV